MPQIFNLSTIVVLRFGILVSLLGFISIGSSERILSVAFWSTKSHKITYDPLLEALAARGHNITVLSPMRSKKLIQNIHEVITMDFDDFLANSNLIDLYELKEKKIEQWNPLHFISAVHDFCRLTLDQRHVQEILKEKFDLILIPILFNECAVAYAHNFNVNTILISPISVVSQISTLYGNPSPPSFVPNPFTGLTDRMTFHERIVNFFTEVIVQGVVKFQHFPAIDKIAREKFSDPNFPSVETLIKNSSLILSNSHFTLSTVRPFLPDIIEVGGMHCHPARSLPQDLSTFVNNSGSDGFILFSMGTTLIGSNMPEQKRRQFLSAFGKLKQSVLWKWETEAMSDLPKNVKLSKWLPQQDLLGHPNIKAFITHGGFGSTTEAVYHGVPLIGIPMFADQIVNMKGAVQSGFAVTLDFNLLTEENFLQSINTVIYDPSYKRNAQALSRTLRDQPDKPLDRAVFWTEYVLRHKGARHLRSAARDLNFFQYHSIDVIGFLVSITFIMLWLSLKVLRRIFGAKANLSDKLVKSNALVSKKKQ